MLSIVPVFAMCSTALQIALFLSTTGLYVLSDHDFGYDPFKTLSPDKWPKKYKHCAGKYQSPINIEEKYVTRVQLPPLEFTGSSDFPYISTLMNNGHTVMLEINGPEPITVSGGPLKGSYTFQQLHFHWGTNNSAGSEESINNHRFSMELHIVFYKTIYYTMENALNYKDGLTVLSLFFKTNKNGRDNDIYSALVDSLDFIPEPNQQVKLQHKLPLDAFLPINKENYFTYNGSLTTPPCLEVVTWIQFEYPVSLSSKQIASFRKLKSMTGYLTNNARPLQPLHGRKVFYNTADLKHNVPKQHLQPFHVFYIPLPFYLV